MTMNIFVNYTPANAEEVNENFNQITKVANERAIANGALDLDSGPQKMIDTFKLATGVNLTSDTSNTDANFGATTTYDSKSFDFSSQDESPKGIFFNDDLSKLYLLGRDNNTVYQYTLSTPGDISTASYASKSYDFSSQDTAAQGICFNNDGSKMYIVGHSNKYIYQYTLSTAWDVNTASYASKSYDFSDETTTVYGIYFSFDGSKMYLSDDLNNLILQYNLSTDWDVSTAAYRDISLNVSPENLTLRYINFSVDGKHLYLSTGSKYIFQYNLSTSWDLRTAVYENNTYYLDFSFFFSADGLFLNSTGTKMYVAEPSLKKIYQFTLKNPKYISSSAYLCKTGSGVDYADSVIQSNSFAILTDSEKIFVTPYLGLELNTGDSITFDVSANNGTSYLTDQTINTWVDISSLTNTGECILKLNLNTNDGSTTPLVNGWCVLFE